MNEIDDKVAALLNLPLLNNDGAIQFTDTHKKIIHEISKMCSDIPLIQDTKKQVEKYAEGFTAEEIYFDMITKIAEAPTKIHMRLSARMLIPIIDKKLRNENVNRN